MDKDLLEKVLTSGNVGPNASSKATERRHATELSTLSASVLRVFGGNQPGIILDEPVMQKDTDPVTTLPDTHMKCVPIRVRVYLLSMCKHHGMMALAEESPYKMRIFARHDTPNHHEQLALGSTRVTYST